MTWNAKYAFWVNSSTRARVGSPANFARILMTMGTKDIKTANKIDGRRPETTPRITVGILLIQLSHEILASCGTLEIIPTIATGMAQKMIKAAMMPWTAYLRTIFCHQEILRELQTISSGCIPM